MRKQAFTIKYIVSINYLVWPKAPAHKNILIGQGYPRGSELISQEALKGQYRSQAFLATKQPKPAEFTFYSTQKF